MCFRFLGLFSIMNPALLPIPGLFSYDMLYKIILKPGKSPKKLKYYLIGLYFPILFYAKILLV